MTPILRFGKLGIYGLMLIPVFLVVVCLGGFSTLVPTAPTNTLQEYETIAQQTFTQINWEDAFILDYFRLQNDFSNVTPSQVQATVNLFYKTETVANGKNAKGQTIYKQVKVPISLLQVMTSLGYTQDEYQAALQLEPVVAAQLSDAGDGLTDTGPLQPVTVAELAYQPVNAQLLYDYVHQQGSVFTQADINTIIAAAQKYDVSAVLMIAITGQELSFVPANNPNASEMEQNPFDVQAPGQDTPGNWSAFHSSLADSADIAAGTIYQKLIYPPTNGENPILWLNDPMNPDGAYAQDPNWGYGVADIFQAINDFLKDAKS